MEVCSITEYAHRDERLYINNWSSQSAVLSSKLLSSIMSSVISKYGCSSLNIVYKRIVLLGVLRETMVLLTNIWLKLVKWQCCTLFGNTWDAWGCTQCCYRPWLQVRPRCAAWQAWCGKGQIFIWPVIFKHVIIVLEGLWVNRLGTLLLVGLIRSDSHQIHCILSCLIQAIAEESHSESKWKQLGELAMSVGKVQAYLK